MRNVKADLSNYSLSPQIVKGPIVHHVYLKVVINFTDKNK